MTSGLKTAQAQFQANLSFYENITFDIKKELFKNKTPREQMIEKLVKELKELYAQNYENPLRKELREKIVNDMKLNFGINDPERDFPRRIKEYVDDMYERFLEDHLKAEATLLFKELNRNALSKVSTIAKDAISKEYLTTQDKQTLIVSAINSSKEILNELLNLQKEGFKADREKFEQVIAPYNEKLRMAGYQVNNYSDNKTKQYLMLRILHVIEKLIKAQKYSPEKSQKTREEVNKIIEHILDKFITKESIPKGFQVALLESLKPYLD